MIFDDEYFFVQLKFLCYYYHIIYDGGHGWFFLINFSLLLKLCTILFSSIYFHLAQNLSTLYSHLSASRMSILICQNSRFQKHILNPQILFMLLFWSLYLFGRFQSHRIIMFMIIIHPKIYFCIYILDPDTKTIILIFVRRLYVNHYFFWC